MNGLMLHTAKSDFSDLRLRTAHKKAALNWEVRVAKWGIKRTPSSPTDFNVMSHDTDREWQNIICKIIYIYLSTLTSPWHFCIAKTPPWVAYSCTNKSVRIATSTFNCYECDFKFSLFLSATQRFVCIMLKGHSEKFALKCNAKQCESRFLMLT